MSLHEMLKWLSKIIKPTDLAGFRKISGNYLRLYNSVRNGADRAQTITDLGWTNNYYQHQAAELRDRLFNFILFVEPDQMTATRRAWLECHRNYTLVKILLGFHSRQLAIVVAEKTLKKCIRYEFSHLVFDFAKEMMKYAGAVTGDARSFNMYRDLATEYLEIIRAEFLAESYLNEATLQYAQKLVAEETALPMLRSFIQELQPFSKSVTTYRFHLMFAYLQVFEKEAAKDEARLIVVCDRALEFFEQKDFATPAATKSVFLLKKIMVYVNRNDSQNAITHINKVLAIEYPQSHNYAIALQYKVLVALRENDAELVTTIIVSLKNEKGYLREVWKILEAYIHLFVAYGEMEAMPALPKFRLRKFLNEMPIANRDKMGFNASLLILQFMFLLLKGDKGRDELIDRAKSLSEYVRTHFRGRDDLRRTRVFMQMLLELPKNSYRKGVVAYQIKGLARQLKAASTDAGGQGELEIVPYERLWKMVMRVL